MSQDMFKTAQDGFDFSVGDFIVIAPPNASQNGRQDESKSVALDALGGLPEITQDMPTGFKMVGRAQRASERSERCERSARKSLRFESIPHGCQRVLPRTFWTAHGDYTKTLQNNSDGHLFNALPVPCSLQVFFHSRWGFSIKIGPRGLPRWTPTWS